MSQSHIPPQFNITSQKQRTKLIIICLNQIITDKLFICLFLLLERRGKPVQTFVEPIASCGAASLDVPLSVTEAVETKLVGHFSGTHGVRQVLLIREDEENGFAELVFVKHSVQLIAGGIDTITIVRVDHEDETLSVLIVMPPEGTDLVLSSDVPHSEANILVFDGLDVEPCTINIKIVKTTGEIYLPDIIKCAHQLWESS